MKFPLWNRASGASGPSSRASLQLLDNQAQAILDATPPRRMQAILEFGDSFNSVPLPAATKMMIVRQLITSLARRIDRENKHTVEERYAIPAILRIAERVIRPTTSRSGLTRVARGAATRNHPCEFIGIDFSLLSLRSLNLAGVQFIGCNFDNSMLDETNLSNCILVDCSLRNAVLANATARRTDFSGSNLTGANLFSVDGRDALFVKTKLDNADLSFGNFAAGNFSGSSLANVSYYSGNFAGALFTAVENFDEQAAAKASRLS